MEKINCVICGSQKTAEIYRNYGDKHFDKIDYLKGKPSIAVMCLSCGLVYHNPRLDVKETELIYSKLYRQREPSAEYLKDKAFKFDERAEWLNARLNGALRGKAVKIMDIGCGEGSSLLAFQRIGWQACGIEPSELFSEYGRKKLGLDIKTGFFCESTFNKEEFDVVSLIRVLEHIYDPVTLLKAAAGKIKKDGCLFIEVPHLKEPRDDISKHFFNSTTLYNFTQTTLGFLLDKCGLEVRECVCVNGGVRCIAMPSGKAGRSIYRRRDSYLRIKLIVLRHRLRWFLAVKLKKFLKKLLRING